MPGLTAPDRCEGEAVPCLGVRAATLEPHSCQHRPDGAWVRLRHELGRGTSWTVEMVWS